MHGVQPQSEKVWRQADKYGVPRICFINKIDKMGADFEHAIDTIRKRLNAKPVAIQIPIGQEDKFRGVVDLIEMKAIVWNDETMGAEYVTESDSRGAAEEGGSVPHAAGRNGCRERRRHPAQVPGRRRRSTAEELRSVAAQVDHRAEAVPGRAGYGVQEQRRSATARCGGGLPALPARYAGDAGHQSGKRRDTSRAKPDDKEPFSALAFKIMADPFVGQLTFIRVYSGQLKSGESVLNVAHAED